MFRSFIVLFIVLFTFCFTNNRYPYGYDQRWENLKKHSERVQELIEICEYNVENNLWAKVKRDTIILGITKIIFTMNMSSNCEGRVISSEKITPEIKSGNNLLDINKRKFKKPHYSGKKRKPSEYYIKYGHKYITKKNPLGVHINKKTGKRVSAGGNEIHGNGF